MAVGPTKGSASRERAAAMIGRTLSERYRIVEVIAMGGMGAVYRAEHLTMRKQIAVKVLHPEVEDFPELSTRFEREAVAGAHIQHPNVATASDFGTFDGESRFLVLELVDGITLKELIDQGPVAPMRAADIAKQTASALGAVHGKGIVHRDMKPQNVMLVDKGDEQIVKLIDFGFAKVPVEELSALAQDDDSPDAALTRAGTVVGTMGYLAPEAALGAGAITPQSDLYALGVIFYQMLSGKPPFEGKDAVEMFMKHRTSPVPPLHERNPSIDVPASLEAVVRKLLEKDPSQRYRSAEALIAALEDAMSGSAEEPAHAETAPASAVPEATTSTSAATKSVSQPTKASNATRGMALLLGGLLVGGGVIAFYELTQKEPEPAPALTATAVVTATATATASAAPAPPPPALERLRAANDAKNPQAAYDLLVELMANEPDAFAQRAMQGETASVLAATALAGLPTIDAFRHLTRDLGTHGIDILYDIMMRERSNLPAPGAGMAIPSAAGARARDLLAEEALRERGTPALRVAYDLLMTPCLKRPELFERAAKEGGDRALAVLRALQLPACTRAGACCFPDSRALERAIVDIQSRQRH